MANEIDQLMSLDPLELSAQDIDSIIAYQRKARAAWDSGVKPKKGTEGPKITLADLGLKRKGPEPIRRRLV